MIMEGDLPDKILWLGPYAVGEYFDDLLAEKTYVQTAANRVEGFYINELYDQTKAPIDVISALITIPYPTSPRKLIGEEETKISDNITIYNIPFVNRPYVSILSQELSLKKKVLWWCKQNKGKKVWVIVYSMRLPLLKCVSLIKENLENVKVINIVPDLPQYMRSDSSFFRRLAMKPYQKKIRAAQKNVDLFSLYTESMKGQLPCEDKKTIVIEGLFDADNYVQKLKKQTKHRKVVLYAGGLSEQYGLGILVDSFRLLKDENIELNIYGQGEYVSRLTEVENELPNVKYKGLVSPSQAFEKICDADLVINPRPSAPEYTRYSFPSKIFEYMASGTPVLMTKLPGIQKEYFDYVYTIEDETASGIAEAIRVVFKIDEQDRLGRANRAADFIKREKSASHQVERLINAITDLN